MYFKAKYIILENFGPVVFTELMQHSEVARALGANQPITGAGFVYVNADGGYTCYGESISLRVKSNGEDDAKILNKYLGGKQDEDL